MVWCDFNERGLLFLDGDKSRNFVQPTPRYGRLKMKKRFDDDGKTNDLPDAVHISRRPQRRDPNEIIQMSIRMDVEVYEKFQRLRKKERRTNGDMLLVLLESYKQAPLAAPSRPIDPARPQLLSARLGLLLYRGRRVGRNFASTLGAIVQRLTKLDR